MYYIDTNIFIRAMTGDDIAKKEACQKMLRRISEREIVATTTESVLAEIVYVLSSKKVGYNLSREAIRSRLYPILQLSGLHINNRATYLKALDLYVLHNIDFEDAILLAYALENDGVTGIYSYDQKLGNNTGVTRLVP